MPAIDNLLSVEALVRKMGQLDKKIEASTAHILQDKADIKKYKADKIKLNKIIALAGQMDDTDRKVVAMVRKYKCPKCDYTALSPAGLGSHKSFKHGISSAAKKAPKKAAAK
jgi:hypothetical protein